jgi:hypothetical protein
LRVVWKAPEVPIEDINHGDFIIVKYENYSSKIVWIRLVRLKYRVKMQAASFGIELAVFSS